MSASRSRGATTLLLALGVAAASLATHAEVPRFDFVDYDDPDYVLENPPVRQGLSWAGLRWAFTAAHASNWHPLTWLAHMLDVQLFGLDPAGHHASSAVLHALAGALCFLALRALTQRTSASLLVALLFALHPLRVESVAWVSERKDVLSGVFFFLTLHAYARFAQKPRPARLWPVCAWFALGLLAKPMLVTTPFVLLLLDLWPLERFRSGDGWRGAGRLVLEKTPLFLLAALSCAVTVHAQRAGGSLYALEVLPLSERLANAPQALARYLGHFLAPTGLAYFYPHPGLVAERDSPWTGTALAALALVLVASLAALACVRRMPVLLLGWSWFLGMLVPVIGLVQVGEQALADRYAYLPAVGLQLALVHGLGALAARHARLRAALLLAAPLVLAACALASARQARVWRDSETLFRHALAVTERNYPAFLGLANALAERGDVDGARASYEAALAIRPSYAPALYGLGLLEQEHGDAQRALELYRAATEALPRFAAAHLNLGSLLAARGEAVAAAEAFERVLELHPGHPEAHYDLALLLLLHGRREDALPHLESAVRGRPDFAAAWEKLGELHEARGEHRAALAAFERALRDPARTQAAILSAWILASAAEPELRDAPRALELARRAVQASARRDPRALEALAAALAASGDFARAAALQEEALALLAPGQQGEARARLERYRRGEPHVHEH